MLLIVRDIMHTSYIASLPIYNEYKYNQKEFYDKAKEMIKNHGYEKFLFGSDFPMWDFKGELNIIDQLGLSDKEKEAILYGNAKKLLESL